MGRFHFPWGKTDEAEALGGAAAREQAQQALEGHQDQHEEVTLVAARLRELRESNHFADRITNIMRG